VVNMLARATHTQTTLQINLTGHSYQIYHEDIQENVVYLAANS